MSQNILRIVWGIVAAGIYLFIIGLLIFYFNHRTDEKKKHYVKKDDHRIQVAIATSANGTLIPPVQAKKVSKPKKEPIRKPKPKTKLKPKAQKKPEPAKRQKVIKEKIVKKAPKRKKERTKKPKKRVNDLFAGVKTEKKKPLIKVTQKPIHTVPKKKLFEMVDAKPSKTKKPSRSLKQQKQLDSGVEDDYLAKVQEMLEGWPAQSDFAGEKVKVYLKIDPTGHFEFEIKRRSRNPEFNRALTDYLEQLQEFGFGPHKGSRTYLFEAEFIAKE
ncbi:TonB-like; putative TolA function [hydrothermal vent metagenome]|uniref:TonB-like putative TolA function n=1 Tax=hydrothermal vent metagenome TaxID=652676 RepID=A0A1W1E709_9ZZZZ